MSEIRWHALASLVCGLVFSGLVWANPCALPGGVIRDGLGGTGQQAKSGMGGTGQQAKSGIGGTGQQAKSGVGGTGRQATSGMGGTGAKADGSGMGGTGVVGIITGFGSICVNGLELHYDAKTPVSVDGKPASAKELAVGQMVSAQAEGSGTSLKARRIDLNSAVAGPVGWVARDGKTFAVLGQTVRFADAAMPGRNARATAPAVGSHVRVSGMRAVDGTISATHVEPIKAGKEVSVSGIVTTSTRTSARIGNLQATGVNGISPGTSVRVTGRVVGGVLQARQVTAAPEMAHAGKAEHMVLQGIVHEADAESISLGYTRLAADAARDLDPGEWVRVEVERRPDGRLEVMRMHLDRRPADRGVGTGGRAQAQGKTEHVGKDERDGRGRERDVHRDGHAEGRNKPERQEKPEKTEKPEAVEKPEKAEKPEEGEKPERPERDETPEKSEVPDRSASPERHDGPVKVSRR